MIIFIRIALLFLVILGSLPVFAQTASLLPNAKQTFLDKSGNPLSSGKVYFYIPATTTFKTTWQDSSQSIANVNPVVLDSAGTAIIYGNGSYRQIVRDVKGNTIWDQLTSSTGAGSGGTPATGDGNLVGTVLPWAGLSAPNQYVFGYGQEISRVTYATFMTAITLTGNVTCSSGSPILTNLADTTQIPVGAAVEVICIAPGSTVISKTTTTITVTNNSSVTSVASAVIFPWGNGDGSTTLNVPDYRGRVVAGRDNMGGTAANRLTSTYFGETAAALGANGGVESRTLVGGNLPAYTPTGTVGITDPGHNHTLAPLSGLSVLGGGGAATGTVGGAQASALGAGNLTSSSTTGITAGFTGTAQGGTSTAFSIIQPTITINYIVKVTPDTNSAEATGVLSLGGMTGVIACGGGLTCTGNVITSTSSGIVNSGTADQVAYYATNGIAVSGTSTIPLAVQDNITKLGTLAEFGNLGNFGIIGGNTKLINVRQYVTCDGTTDDTAGFILMATDIRAATSAIVDFPANATCRVWPTNASANANTTLMDLTGVSGVRFNFNGSIISSAFTASTSNVIAFLLSNSSRVVINDYNHTTAAGKSETTSVWHFAITDGANQIRINRAKANGGAKMVGCSRTAGGAQARSYDLEFDINVVDVAYGFTTAYDCDDVRGFVRSNNADRSYYAYGSRNHIVNIESVNPTINDILVGCWPTATGTAFDNSTTGIKIKYTNRNSTTSTVTALAFGAFQATGVSQVCQSLQASVDMDVTLVTTAGPFAELISYVTNGVLGDAAHKFDIKLSGVIRGSYSTQLLNLASAANGFGNTASVRISLENLSIPTNTSTALNGVGTATCIFYNNVRMPMGAITFDAAPTCVNTINSEFSNLDYASSGQIISQNIVPWTDNTKSLGTATQRFSDAHLTTGTVSTWKFAGSSSGTVTVQGAAAAGTWTLTLPTSGGTTAYPLTTNGAGVGSWSQLTGAGIATNTVAFSNIAQGATNTVVANVTSGTANFAAFAMPSCSASASVLIWTTNTGFGCSTYFSSISALSVLGNAGSSSGPAAAITGTANQVLRINGAGTANGYGSIDISQSATVGTSRLAYANLVQGATNTVVANATSGTANFAAFSMPSCSAATSALIWTTNTGFGCHTISGGSPVIIYASTYLTCNGIADDTAGFVSLTTAINTAVGAVVEFPANATCKVWPNTGSGTTTPTLLAISGMTSLAINFNGTTISSGITTHIARLRVINLATSSNITINGLKIIDAEGKSPTADWGIVGVQIGTSSRIAVNQLSMTGGLAAVLCARTPGGGVSRSFNIDFDATTTNVYYGFSAQYDCDSVRGFVKTQNAARSYYPYGISDHDINVNSINPDGAEDVVLGCQASNSGDGQDNSTTGIRLKYTNTNSNIDIGTVISVFNGNNGNNTVTSTCNMIQAEVDLDVVVNVSANGPLIEAKSYVSCGASCVALGDAAHINNIVFKGRVSGANNTQFVEYGTTGQGYGNTINSRVSFRDLDLPQQTATLYIGVGTLTCFVFDNVNMASATLTTQGAVEPTCVTTSSSRFSNLTNGVFVQRSAWTTLAVSQASGLACNGGTLTAATGSVIYWRQGKSIFMNIGVTITTIGSCTGFLKITIPYAALNNSAGGGRNLVDGNMMQTWIQGTTAIINMAKYDNTLGMTTGDSVNTSMVFELQ